MADYVENYQTSVDTQSGQNWQKMQENITNTFTALQNANITSIKENAETAIKQNKIIQDRNSKVQADTLDWTTDLKAQFPEVDSNQFEATFGKAIQTRADLKAKMLSGLSLTEKEKKLYVNVMNTPNLVKKALANRIALMQGYGEALNKDMGTPGAYSIANLDTNMDKFVHASTPVKGGPKIINGYTLNENFTDVDVYTQVEGQEPITLKGSNLDGAFGENGNGGFYKVADIAGYVQSARASSNIFYKKEDLTSGQPGTLVDSVKPQYLEKGKGKLEKIPGTDGYKVVRNISQEGQKIIKNQIGVNIAAMPLGELLTWGIDKLHIKQGTGEGAKWIDATWLSNSENKENLKNRISEYMFSTINVPQPEMDTEGSGVRVYPGPKKPNKTDSSGHSAGWKRKYNLAISQGLSDADAKAYANSK